MRECESALQATAREDSKRRENENEQLHPRRDAPGVQEYKSAQQARAREEPGVQDH